MSKHPLSQPIMLGEKTLPNAIFYAPLAGCSDFPFRQMSAKYKPGLMYCEMVKMEALIRNDSNTFHLLDYMSNMRPIGAQLCGSNPKIAGQAARIIEDLGFDVVDFNCGCPVDKVTKDGSGSGMLKNPQLIGEVLTAMVAAVKIPVTVKIRAGWDESNIIVSEVTKIAEAAGAKAICVHGRTRQQGYKGPANWDYIKAAKQAAHKIKVIGNGDIIDPQSAVNVQAITGCDAVLVARGTMGQPWIVQDILDFLNNEPLLQRSIEARREALLEHYQHIIKYQPDRRVTLDVRRIGCWYFKKSSGTKAFREKISHAQFSEIADLILNFPINENESDETELEECTVEC